MIIRMKKASLSQKYRYDFSYEKGVTTAQKDEYVYSYEKGVTIGKQIANITFLLNRVPKPKKWV